MVHTNPLNHGRGCQMQSAVRYTAAYLESIPDAQDGTRYEIIDGELYVSRQPHWEHQYTSTGISSALDRWSRATKRGVVNTAPGVIFSEYDSVAPDLVWISYARLREGLLDDGKLHVAPELMVEILSAGSGNVRRDREAKLKLYDETGVLEYWIVDWRTKSIDVFRRDGDRLQFGGTLSGRDRLTSPPLPGFEIGLEEIWDPGIDA